MSVTIRTAASPARVSTYLPDNQIDPQVAALSDGGYVVVWTSQSQTGEHGQGDIYSQRYDAAGNPVGVETLVNTVLGGYQGSPGITAMDDGGYLVTWSSYVSGYLVPSAQRFDSAGAAVGGEINPAIAVGAELRSVTPVALEGGGYALVWIDTYSFTGVHVIRAQRYDDAGVATGAVIDLGSATGFDTPAVQLIPGEDGAFVAAWSSGAALSARIIDAGGVVSEVIGLPGIGPGGWDIAALANGGFVAVGRGSGFVYQMFGADGQPSGEVRSYAGAYAPSAVAALADGGFVVTWNGVGLRLQAFDSAGDPVGQEVAVSALGTMNQTVVGLVGGGYAAIWQANGDFSSADIHQRVYSAPRASATLTAAIENADGDGADDVFLAAPAALNAGDRIGGGAGQDALQLTETGTTDLAGVFMTGVERIVGTAGNDVVILGDIPADLLTLESGGGQDILRLEDGADLADLPILVGDWTIEPPTDGHHFVITGPYQGAPMALDGLDFGIDASGYALTRAEREALFADGVSQIVQPGGYTFIAADEAIAPGPAVQVNTTPGGGLTQIARLGDGYVVVWSAYTNNPSSTIFAQRYDADGVKIGGEISWPGVANVETSVIGLDNGFVVSWTSVSGASGGKVLSQQFDLAGARVGAEQVLYNSTSGSLGWVASAEVSGGYVVSWSSSGVPTSGYELSAQRFDASGAKVGAVFTLNTTTPGDQFDAELTSLAGGGFAAAWRSWSGNEGDLRLQRFDATGAKVGAEVLVAGPSQHIAQSSIVGLANGEVALAWITRGDDGLVVVRSQRYDASGAKVGPQTEAGGYPIESYPSNLSVEALSDGGYVIVWQAYEIFSQRYDASGSAVGQETQLNLNEAGDLWAGVVTVLDNGDLVAAWSRSTGPAANQSQIETSRVASVAMLGLTAGADVLAANAAPRLVTTEAGHLGASDSLVGGSAIDRLDLTSAGTLDLTAPAAFSGFEIIAGSAGDDRFIVSAARLSGVTDLFGGAGEDAIRAAAGGVLDLTAIRLHDIETIEGSAGDDTVIVNLSTLRPDQHLVGGDGTDTLQSAGYGIFDLRGWSFSGFEVLRGSASYDTFILSAFRPDGVLVIDGGDGPDDTVDYSLAAAGVTMTAAHLGIEILYGSGFDDVIRAGEVGGRYMAGAGDDVVHGGAGFDAIFAGSGNNTVYGGGGNDQIRAGDDSLVSDHNVFYGEAGSDNLYGGRGDDNLYGGDGGDMLSGGEGDDFLAGEAGNDTLNGASGSNALYGQAGNDILYGTDLLDRDFLFGGQGNDTYYVASSLTGPLDLVFEGGENPDVAGGAGDVDTIFTQGAFFWDYYGVGEILRISGVSNAQLVGGTNNQSIFGSAATDYISVYGGSNRVDAGRGTDAVSFSLYGLDESYDGVNTLVMKAGNGLDYVYDFESGVDKVDLTAFGFGITGQQVLDQAVNVDQAGTANDYCYFYLTSAGGVDNFVAFMGLLSSQLQAGDFIT